MFLSVPKKLGSLEFVLEETSRFLKTEQVAGEISFAVTLAVDEIFSNFVKYQPCGTQNIEIEMVVEDGAVKTTMQDFDVEEFDFTKYKQADMNALAESASPGGRGLFLINQLTDKIEYRYANRTCTVVITKFLGSHHV